MKIKTLDIQAKDWRDKTYGNSYFSARITLNFGMKNEKTIRLPFQYGYGGHYIDMAFKAITGERTHYYNYCQENKITLRYNKQERCLKREVIAWGQED